MEDIIKRSFPFLDLPVSFLTTICLIATGSQATHMPSVSRENSERGKVTGETASAHRNVHV